MDRHTCRARTKDNRQWVQGYYACLNDTTYCFKEDYEMHPENTKHYIIVDEMTDWCLPNEHKLIEVILETVCQFTGWIDSYQTPIFEKDIVEFVGPSTDRVLVCWCNEMNEMNAVPLDGIMFDGFDYWNTKYPKFTYSDFCCMLQDPYGDFKEIKVVGNIVDNPELLEENKS